MGLEQRVGLYQQIEGLRERPLIVYVTSQRVGAAGAMASDVLPEFISQLEKIPGEIDKVDILIESTGGDGLVVWRLMSLIRERFKDVSALIPCSAFSAATLLALGCNNIIMGKYGCLGPIDPQMIVKKKDGSLQLLGYQDIVAYLDFVHNEAGLTEQTHSESAFKILCEQVEPGMLGVARRASSLSVTMGEKLLQTHMTTTEKKIKASSIAKQLNESYFSHGHALCRDEAKQIGLAITDAEQNIEKLMWSIHEDVETDLKVKESFLPVGVFLSDPAARVYLQSPPPLHIPPQISQQTIMQLIQNYFNQQIQVAVPDVTVELTHAVVESCRYASAFQTKSKILLTRTQDLKFIANMVQLNAGWNTINLPNNQNQTGG
jgi:hypothetical protein